MKVTYEITFRRFNEEDEKRDSGYYDGLNTHKRAHIAVNRNDDTFEQVLTVYHEVTHALVELLLRYKLDKKHKLITRQDKELKKMWDAWIAKDIKDTEEDREEKVCRAVEEGVKKALRKTIPPNFYMKMFEQSKTFKKPKKKPKKRKV